MTLELYAQCFIASLIGIVFHVIVKIISLSKDHKKANIEFSVGQYFKDDKWALLGDLFAAIVLIYIIDEWLELDNKIMHKVKSIFIFVGFSGSYVVLQLLSVAKDKFRRAVDVKTNIADEVTGDLAAPTKTTTKP